eukprot:Opistho-2@63255
MITRSAVGRLLLLLLLGALVVCAILIRLLRLCLLLSLLCLLPIVVAIAVLGIVLSPLPLLFGVIRLCLATRLGLLSIVRLRCLGLLRLRLIVSTGGIVVIVLAALLLLAIAAPLTLLLLGLAIATAKATLAAACGRPVAVHTLHDHALGVLNLLVRAHDDERLLDSVRQVIAVELNAGARRLLEVLDGLATAANNKAHPLGRDGEVNSISATASHRRGHGETTRAPLPRVLHQLLDHLVCTAKNVGSAHQTEHTLWGSWDIGLELDAATRLCLEPLDGLAAVANHSANKFAGNANLKGGCGTAIRGCTAKRSVVRAAHVLRGAIVTATLQGLQNLADKILCSAHAISIARDNKGLLSRTGRKTVLDQLETSTAASLELPNLLSAAANDEANLCSRDHHRDALGLAHRLTHRLTHLWHTARRRVPPLLSLLGLLVVLTDDFLQGLDGIADTLLGTRHGDLAVGKTNILRHLDAGASLRLKAFDCLSLLPNDRSDGAVGHRELLSGHVAEACVCAGLRVVGQLRLGRLLRLIPRRRRLIVGGRGCLLVLITLLAH